MPAKYREFEVFVAVDRVSEYLVKVNARTAREAERIASNRWGREEFEFVDETTTDVRFQASATED
jgi:hypothetical protein